MEVTDMIITIGGEYGCGGKRIAERAAELLGYTCWDDHLVTEAIKDYGVDLEESTFRYFDESQGSGSMKELAQLSKAQLNYRQLVNTLTADTLPLDQRMVKAQEKLFEELGQKGDCILLGRAADHYLRNYPDRISVFVIDDEEYRVQRIMEHFDIDEASAKKAIKKTDQRRSDYYAFFTGKKWGDINNYDLILRCNLLGIEGSAKLLKHLVDNKSGKL
jgi:cytidylate kinase